MRCIVPAFAAFGVPAPGAAFCCHNSTRRIPGCCGGSLPSIHAAKLDKLTNVFRPHLFPYGEIQRLALAFTSLSCVERISAMTVKICSLSAAGSSVRSLRLRLPSLIPSAAASSHSLNPFVATAFRISALARFIKSPSHKDITCGASFVMSLFYIRMLLLTA